MLREEFSGACFKLWKNSTFCHSERSEESLSFGGVKTEERFLASLGMTKNYFFGNFVQAVEVCWCTVDGAATKFHTEACATRILDQSAGAPAWLPASMGVPCPRRLA